MVRAIPDQKTHTVNMGDVDVEEVVVEKWSQEDVLALERWWIKTKARRSAHEVSAGAMEKIHKAIAFPSVLVSAVLSSVTFQDGLPEFLAPTLSIIVTLGATTQAFFGFQGKGEGHRGVSRAFGALQRDIELEIVRQETPFSKFFEKVNTTYSALLQDAPVLTAAGKQILETEGRGEAPNPFESFRKITAVVT